MEVVKFNSANFISSIKGKYHIYLVPIHIYTKTLFLTCCNTYSENIFFCWKCGCKLLNISGRRVRHFCHQIRPAEIWSASGTNNSTA